MSNNFKSEDILLADGVAGGVSRLAVAVAVTGVAGGVSGAAGGVNGVAGVVSSVAGHGHRGVAVA